jgi:hypothetical protein
MIGRQHDRRFIGQARRTPDNADLMTSLSYGPAAMRAALRAFNLPEEAQSVRSMQGNNRDRMRGAAACMEYRPVSMDL